MLLNFSLAVPGLEGKKIKGKINILHLTYDMGIGGAEQVIRNLVEGTDLARFNPAVLCLDNKIGALGIKLKKNGYRVSSMDRKPGLDFNLIKAIRYYVKKNKIGILHCHQYTPYTYGLLSALYTNVKVIFTEHGRFYPDRYKWKRVLVNPVFSLRTSAITSISNATRDALVKYELMPRKRIEVIYNGLKDLSGLQGDDALLRQSMGIKEGDLILGTISRLDPIKNQRLMFEAFKEIRNIYRNTKLIIVGDGPLRGELERQSELLGIKDCVIFTGFQVDPQKYLGIMDIFLLPSLSEGASMTLLEAMSFCKPCVVTNAGGNPEIVLDGETGFVTPNCDKEAFIIAIKKLLDNVSLRKKTGDSGRKRYETHFTLERMVSLYQDLYLKVCRQTGADPA